MPPIDLIPVVAAAFAVPQFLPQLHRLRGPGASTDGLSTTWALLTAVSNTAWIVYFAQVGYRTAMIPNASVVVMSLAVATAITRRRGGAAPGVSMALLWAGLLATVFAIFGTDGLRTVLAAAFVVQVTPSLWSAYRATSAAGISIGTWRLVLGEMACWCVFGLLRPDPSLALLGATGIIASVAMLLRAAGDTTSGRRHRATGPAPAQVAARI